MAQWEREQIGDCVLYRGLAEEVVSILASVHAVVTDPPYGMHFDFTKVRRTLMPLPHAGPKLQGQPTPDRLRGIQGDGLPFDPRPWLRYPEVILWGANHYSARLPTSAAWLIWDKRCGGTPDCFSDCELAWTNLSMPARIHRQLWRGAIRMGEENPSREGKVYPSQKPVALMRWCLRMTQGCILDPYMGSGSTLVAAVELGRPCIGIDIDVEAFDIACVRVSKASAQGRLPPPVRQLRPHQERLLA
jgi:site-specific DNA-methyltransferase (adenine-specific)